MCQRGAVWREVFFSHFPNPLPSPLNRAALLETPLKDLKRAVDVAVWQCLCDSPLHWRAVCSTMPCDRGHAAPVGRSLARSLRNGSGETAWPAGTAEHHTEMIDMLGSAPQRRLREMAVQALTEVQTHTQRRASRWHALLPRNLANRFCTLSLQDSNNTLLQSNFCYWETMRNLIHDAITKTWLCFVDQLGCDSSYQGF